MPKTSHAKFNLQPIYEVQHHERLLLIFLRATNHVVKNIRQLFLLLSVLDVKIVKAIRQHTARQEGQNQHFGFRNFAKQRSRSYSKRCCT